MRIKHQHLTRSAMVIALHTGFVAHAQTAPPLIAAAANTVGTTVAATATATAVGAAAGTVAARAAPAPSSANHSAATTSIFISTVFPMTNNDEQSRRPAGRTRQKHSRP